jgi:hypothetical protein
MRTTLSRDPFARADVVRRSTTPGACCAWCGKAGARYQYDVDVDGRSRAFERRPFSIFEPARVFCSVGCFRAFHV